MTHAARTGRKALVEKHGGCHGNTALALPASELGLARLQVSCFLGVQSSTAQFLQGQPVLQADGRQLLEMEPNLRF